MVRKKPFYIFFSFPKIYPNISFYFLFLLLVGEWKNCCLLLYCLETSVGATKEICPWCTTLLQQYCSFFRNSLRVPLCLWFDFFFLCVSNLVQYDDKNVIVFQCASLRPCTSLLSFLCKHNRELLHFFFSFFIFTNIIFLCLSYFSDVLTET